MTNVNNISEPIQPPGIGQPADPAKKKDGPSFENALSKALDKGQGSKMQESAASGLSEIISPQLNVPRSSASVTGKTDQLLDLLDTYSAKLEDPQVSLKTIEPVLNELNSSAGELLKASENLGQPDEELKRIATQAAVTAQNEYIKFQRGDYLS